MAANKLEDSQFELNDTSGYLEEQLLANELGIL